MPDSVSTVSGAELNGQVATSRSTASRNDASINLEGLRFVGWVLQLSLRESEAFVLSLTTLPEDHLWLRLQRWARLAGFASHDVQTLMWQFIT